MKCMKVTKSNFTGRAATALGKMILSWLIGLVGVVLFAACVAVGVVVDAIVINGKSSFTEVETFQVLDIIVLALFAIIGILLMLLLCAAARTYFTRWKVNNTYINTCKLTFDGKAGQLWGHYIAWTFLTIVTLGIYGLWNGIRLHKWVVKHTYFESFITAEASIVPMPAFSYGYAPMN